MTEPLYNDRGFRTVIRTVKSSGREIVTTEHADSPATFYVHGSGRGIHGPFPIDDSRFEVKRAKMTCYEFCEHIAGLTARGTKWKWLETGGYNKRRKQVMRLDGDSDLVECCPIVVLGHSVNITAMSKSAPNCEFADIGERLGLSREDAWAVAGAADMDINSEDVDYELIVRLALACGLRLHPSYMDDFLRGHIECALWSTHDYADESGGEPLDKNYDIDDLTDECLWRMWADCRDFQVAHRELLDQAHYNNREYSDAEMAGHDFWLTREGHGCGFWDRGFEELGDKLTEAAKVYREFNLYVTEDKKVDNG